MALLLFLLIIPLCFAEDVFVAKAGITPPQIPGADLGSVQQANLSTLQLTLKDANTKNLIGDIHVIVELTNEKTVKTIKYVDQFGILKLDLQPGDYQIILKADKLNTSGADYYYEQRYEISRNLNDTAFLLPVGTVRGTVSYKNTRVPAASVKFDCPGSYGDKEDITTDKYGSFTKEYLPAGSCKLFAADYSRVGEAFVEIKQGSISDVEIVLNKTVRNNLLLIAVIIAAVIVIIVILVHYLLLKKKPLAIKKKITEPSNKRLNDIVKTLNPREKEIVEMLQKEGELIQSKIIHQTGIPKTSIVRIFENLQAKNIIELKKIGKVKKAVLTDWILEKEQK